jgi:hypothetical protein
MTIENTFLDGELPVDPETVPAIDAQVQASPEPIAEPVIETPSLASTPEPRPESGHIPISALLDEREKRKALEARIAQYEQDRAAQPAAAPDPSRDPHGYQQHLMQQVQQTVLDTRLNMSETSSRRHYGDSLTDQAKDWALAKFGTNPAFQNEVLGSPDPYDYAIKAFQRDQISSQVTPDKFAAFQAWESAQAQIASAPASIAPAPSSAPVPRSIASISSAGGGVAHEPNDPESAFAGAFPG